jgi:hypothetical protein
MCGQPIRVVGKVIGLNKAGWPKALGSLQYIADKGSTWEKRYLLTLLAYPKILETIGLPSFETITNPSTAESEVIEEMESYIPDFIAFYKIRSYSGAWSKQTCHLSTKAGPHGLATWTAWKSAFLLSD